MSNHPPASEASTLQRRVRFLVFLTIGLVISFSLPLCDLVRFSWHSDLYSYILLVPFVSLYLVWLKRKVPTREYEPATRLSVVLALLGLVLVAASWTAVSPIDKAGQQDRLSLLILALLFLFGSGCGFCLGSQTLREIVFPLAFLLFMAPLPSVIESRVETFLQHASANTACLILQLSTTPVCRDGTLFVLPGISIDVAPECSGIHSTLVLFLSGLLAGHFFLRRPWTKTVLAAAVILLGIVRNAARIFILAQLCIHVDPRIIDSELHRRGGPLFFVLSLVPFFLLIWLLREIELRYPPPVHPQMDNTL